MQVAYEVREVSPEMGQGVFALKDIPKGTLVWKFDPETNTLFKKQSQFLAMFDQINEVEKRKNILKHCFGIKNRGVCLRSDDGKFINHSERFNIGALRKSVKSEQSEEETKDENSRYDRYALEDIPAGTELRLNYAQSDHCDYPLWFGSVCYENDFDPVSFVKQKSLRRIPSRLEKTRSVTDDEPPVSWLVYVLVVLFVLAFLFLRSDN